MTFTDEAHLDDAPIRRRHLRSLENKIALVTGAGSGISVLTRGFRGYVTRF